MDITLVSKEWAPDLLQYLPLEHTYHEDEIERVYDVYAVDNGIVLSRNQSAVVCVPYGKHATREEAYKQFATEMVQYFEELQLFLRSH